MMTASAFPDAARVGLCCFFVGLSLPGGAAPAAPVAAESFDLRDVRLLDSPFKQAMDWNGQYLLSLEPDRFLCYFRANAGLEPKAQAYGGWEAPNSGAGRCLGHYLSALSLQFRSTGDARFEQRVDYIVDELVLCQQTNGLLTAQAGVKAAFAELAKGKGDALHKSRVPWYIQHKMFAGLRDAYLLTGNEKAKTALLRLSDWAVDVTQALDERQFQVMLEQEHGGMREVLAEVYALTGNKKYLDLANRFSHTKIMAPLAAGRDELNGLHANTQIPKLTGSARIYELTGDTKERDAAAFFWDCVVRHHSYVIGGDSDAEHFGPPDQLAHHLSAVTCETCNTYNMLKLTRHLFAWKPDVEYADYYERALYNQILASQEPATGMFTYFVSLKPGHFRTYSTPTDSFWCCVGTGMENHAQYGNSIYFHRGDELFVNLFIPSELMWKDKHVVVRQETSYPETDRATFTLACQEPVSLTFNFRYPGWALPGLEIKVNGEAVATSAKPGTFVPVRREWHQGDKIEVKIPMGLRTEALPDDPNKIAIFFGPLVLGGALGTEGLPPSLEARDQDKFRKVPDPAVPALATGHKPIELWLKPVAGQSLTFRTEGVGRPNDVTLVAFYREYHERYTVYWNVLPAQDTNDWFLLTSHVNEREGLHLAVSPDGLKWRVVNHDKSVLKPAIPEVFRDPSIAKDESGAYQLVWTIAWGCGQHKGIGYAFSQDLIHWSEQRIIPVMENEPLAEFIWAPELFRDNAKQEWMIHWSSSVTGKYPETLALFDGHSNPRIYYTITKDFKTFTPSRLLFNPDCLAIDSYVYRENDTNYFVFFKADRKESPKRGILMAQAPTPTGPYVLDPHMITAPEEGAAEGPCAIKVGERVRLYYAPADDFGAYESPDMKTWTSIRKDMVPPGGYRHGTVIRITAAEANSLLTHEYTE